MLAAGRLRHRVTIEARDEVKDPRTGAVEYTWAPVFSDVPAAVEPLSGREYIAAQQLQSEVTVRVTMRWRAGLDPKQRIRHGLKIYNPVAFMPDPDSGLEYVTAPCSEGVDGG